MATVMNAPTGLKVFFDSVELDVYLSPFGSFYTHLTDGTELTRESFNDLRNAVEILERRRAAKKRDTTPRQVAKINIDGEKFSIQHFEIAGMSIDGSRVRTKGLKKGDDINGYEALYRPFDPDEREEASRLWMAHIEAERAFKSYIQKRKIGVSKDIGREIEAEAAK